MKSSCLSHPKRRPLIIIRDEFLAITDGNHCAAALLADLEYWTNWKLDDIEQKLKRMEKVGADTATLKREPWIYKTADMFANDLLYLYHEHTVRNALNFLIERKYISRRRNPNYGWDRTYQYKLETDTVQTAMDASTSYLQSHSPSVKIAAHSRQKCRDSAAELPLMDVKNAAIDRQKCRDSAAELPLMDVKNDRAIPETTTEITTETITETTTPTTTENKIAPKKTARRKLKKRAVGVVVDQSTQQQLLKEFGIALNAKTLPLLSKPIVEIENWIAYARAQESVINNPAGLVIAGLLSGNAAPAMSGNGGENNDRENVDPPDLATLTAKFFNS